MRTKMAEGHHTKQGKWEREGNYGVLLKRLSRRNYDFIKPFVTGCCGFGWKRDSTMKEREKVPERAGRFGRRRHFEFRQRAEWYFPMRVRKIMESMLVVYN